MTPRTILPLALAATLSLHTPPMASAEVRLPRIFTDHMVLQQEMPVRVWGWADPREMVSVSFNGKVATTKAGADGTWRVELPAMKADGVARVLKVKGGNTVELKDVLLGEVWIAAGQSNMNREVEVKEADEQLRVFWIHASKTPKKDDLGDNAYGWEVAEPGRLRELQKFREQTFDRGWKQGFAEVGYVFGKRLREELGVPVGLIKSAYGGSIARTWTPRDDIAEEFPYGTEVGNANADGVLYQSMMHGLPPLSVRGVVWYQGETDGRNWKYDEDLAAMIAGWRKRYESPELPFYMAQIAQTTYASGMERVWETQAAVAAAVPGVYLGASNDLWDGGGAGRDKLKADGGTGWPIAGGGNPHPPNKHIVAGRLVDIALAETYGRKPEREVLAPTYKSHRVEGGKVLVTFEHVGEGLKSDDEGSLNWFELSDGSRQAEHDRAPLVYHKAEAKIVGKATVEVSSAAVKSPKEVRLAWHPLARHNLYNSSGIPAINFRTDTQPTKAR